MSKRVLNFSEDINLKLEELKRYLKMPINKIIYMIVNEKLENLKWHISLQQTFFTKKSIVKFFIKKVLHNLKGYFPF